MIREVLEGEPELKILDRIEATAQVIVDTADCAIGIDAANLVLMGLKGFRDDYEEHILHHRCLGSLKNPVPCVALCPAGVDIPGYISLVNEGRCADAVRLSSVTSEIPPVMLSTRSPSLRKLSTSAYRLAWSPQTRHTSTSA